MKTEPNTPAYGVGTDNYHVEGLSKREIFAMNAYAALLSNREIGYCSKEDLRHIAETAVDCADSLIDALNKEVPGE